MYRLYWDAGTGALAPLAMFEELGVPCTRVPVRIDAEEHRGRDYLAINPVGEIPALELPDGRIMTESAAMVLLIGERHPEGGLVPGPDDADRPDFLRWLLFMATSVYMTFTRTVYPERGTTDPDAAEPVRQAALEQLERQYSILDGAIAGAPWFLARGYGALDIYLTMLTDWHPDPAALCERHPAVGRLCTATRRREAFARAMAEDA